MPQATPVHKIWTVAMIAGRTSPGIIQGDLGARRADMDTQRVAVDRWEGLRTFSWARFAVMTALIGTPCLTCASLFIRQAALDRAQAVPAAAQTDSRPLVIVIPSSSPPT